MNLPQQILEADAEFWTWKWGRLTGWQLWPIWKIEKNDDKYQNTYAKFRIHYHPHFCSVPLPGACWNNERKQHVRKIPPPIISINNDEVEISISPEPLWCSYRFISWLEFSCGWWWVELATPISVRDSPMRKDRVVPILQASDMTEIAVILSCNGNHRVDSIAGAINVIITLIPFKNWPVFINLKTLMEL